MPPFRQMPLTHWQVLGGGAYPTPRDTYKLGGEYQPQSHVIYMGIAYPTIIFEWDVQVPSLLNNVGMPTPTQHITTN